MDKLTTKQKAFADNYIISGKATEAAIKADVEQQAEDCGSGWIYCGDGKNNPQKLGRYSCVTKYGEVMECSYDWNIPHTKKMFFRNNVVMNVIAWRYPHYCNGNIPGNKKVYENARKR